MRSPPAGVFDRSALRNTTILHYAFCILHFYCGTPRLFTIHLPPAGNKKTGAPKGVPVFFSSQFFQHPQYDLRTALCRHIRKSLECHLIRSVDLVRDRAEDDKRRLVQPNGGAVKCRAAVLFAYSCPSRYLQAASAATAPSAVAVVTCRTFFRRQSPAQKMPRVFVLQSSPEAK